MGMLGEWHWLNVLMENVLPLGFPQAPAAAPALAILMSALGLSDRSLAILGSLISLHRYSGIPSLRRFVRV